MSVKNFSNTVDLDKMGIPEMKKEIVAISEKTLPDITDAMNGYLLQVVDGAAEWVNLDGNNDQF